MLLGELEHRDGRVRPDRGPGREVPQLLTDQISAYPEYFRFRKARSATA